MPFLINFRTRVLSETWAIKVLPNSHGFFFFFLKHYLSKNNFYQEVNNVKKNCLTIKIKMFFLKVISSSKLLHPN